MAPNHDLFVYVHVYAFVRHVKEKCLLMKLEVMKIIEVNLIVVLIFYSFSHVLSVLEFIKYLCEWIGLLSNYHNIEDCSWIF